MLADGNLLIAERRTYRFQGEFHWADYRLSLRNLGEVREFVLEEGGKKYRKDSSGAPGTYQLRLTPEEFYVRWFYRAKDEPRTFELQYLVTDVVQVYRDVAELYYQFVGAANNYPLGEVEVWIELPQPARYGPVRAWAHGPLWGEVAFMNGKIHLRVKPLPARTYWETRVIFPPEWVPIANLVHPEYRKDQILAEEKQWAEEANRQRERARAELKRKARYRQLARTISPLLAVLGLLFVGVLYYRYGRGFELPYHQKVDSTVPAEFPPAVVSALYFGKQIGAAALGATIFDLARRGFLSLELVSEAEKHWWGKSAPRYALRLERSKFAAGTGLADFERHLLTFFFEEVAEQPDFLELKLLRKRASKVRRWFREWKKLLTRAYLDHYPLYEKKSVTATVVAAVFSFLLLVAGVLITVLMGVEGSWVMVSATIALFLSFLILRYTPEMKLRKRQWSALRRYLKKYYFLSEPNQDWIQQVDRYLVFALALGVGKKAIARMMEVLSLEQQSHYFPWFVYPSGAYATPAEFATAVVSMVSVATSSVSSAAGAGGGASAGGGGGAGGAAGGAG